MKEEKILGIMTLFVFLFLMHSLNGCHADERYKQCINATKDVHGCEGTL